MMQGMQALEQARSLFRERRTRDALFPPELFGEPAWDLLLTLYIARCERRSLSTRTLSRNLNLPVADTLEWVGALEASGLIQERGSAGTGELICISDTGFHTVTTMLLERPARLLS